MTGQEDGRCRVEVMTLTITPDSDEDSEDENLIDRTTDQLLTALERLTEIDNVTKVTLRLDLAT